MNDSESRSSRVAAIILAAGYSSRMEDFKPLLSIGAETIADRVISTFLSNGVDVLLVTGYRKNDLIAGIRHDDITVVENPDYEDGMFSSVRAGVRALLPSHLAFFVMPVDIPLVRRETIRRLLTVSSQYQGRTIYPVFDDRRGHPTLVPRSMASNIVDWQEDGGLKAVLNSRRDLQMEIEVPDQNILMDVDSKEDLELALERFQRFDLPTPRECRTMLDLAGTAANIRRHCNKVAEVGVAIGTAIMEAGRQVDIDLIRAAAVLHDIAKQYGEHDVTGAQMLAEFGFRTIADIVAVHTDLAGGDERVSLEAKIVYFADKLVRDEQIVSVEERYLSAAKKYGFSAGAAIWIQAGKRQALRTKAQLESLVSRPLEEIVRA